MRNRAGDNEQVENEGEEKVIQVMQNDIMYEEQVCIMLILIDMTAYQNLEQERINNSSLKKTNACL